jgi:hypothetical protein
MDNIFELFNNYEVHKYIKDMIHPIGQTLYNECYVYIWFICIYTVFVFVILLMNLFLLLRLTSRLQDNGICLRE